MEVVCQIIFSCLAIALLSYSWILVNWAYLRPKKIEKILRRQGLKGNPYRLIYGDTKDMYKLNEEVESKPIKIGDDIRPRVFGIFLKTVEKHDKDPYFWMGQKPLIILTDVELVKEVLSKNSVYLKPKRTNPLANLFIVGLVTLEKEKWAKQRRLLNPAFHLEKIKLMVPAFYMSCQEVINTWEECVSPKGWCEVDVWPHLSNMARDAISRTAFGSSYEEGKRVFELQKEHSQYFEKVVNSAYIPGSSFLPTKMNRRMKEIDREVQSIIRGLINKRIKAMEAGEAGHEDLLGILLTSSFQAIKENNGNKSAGMSIEEVVEECKVFYFVGQETTATLLAWTMVLLGTFPEWQTRAREEVLQVIGNKKPDFDGLNHLKTVTMIFQEVLRLYPPTAAVSREVNEETKLGKYVLPAGTRLHLPIILHHYDADVWGDDAMEFKPQRFSEGVIKAQKKKQGLYIPFGRGPRICIASNFAMLEAKLVLVMILQRFSFELSPSYAHAPISRLTIRPQHGAHLILHKL